MSAASPSRALARARAASASSTAPSSSTESPPASRRPRARPRRARAATLRAVTPRDAEIMTRVCELARAREGIAAPHPLSACAVTRGDGDVVVEATHAGQGSTRAEIACADEMWRRGATLNSSDRGTVYVNLEPVHGEVAGETRSVEALAATGATRAVVGMLHPLPGLRGRAVRALRERGIEVCVLEGEAEGFEGEAARACRETNEALLYRVATGLPFSVYKYAMTLDGKIATDTGHSSWVTGAEAREMVFRERKRADAVVVGGGTVRKDNPRLTCREETGFQPARVVLTRSLDLPEDAKLWNVRGVAPTIVCTTKGVKPEFQNALRAKGVEVVEFDELTPLAAAQYMFKRGFLRCFWECGGGLAAPAMKSGVFHNVLAFIAPKLVGGGALAPTPLGNLGIEAMHDALPLSGVRLEIYGRDILIRGYVPNSHSTGRLSQLASAGYSVRGLEFNVGESSDDDERTDDGSLISVERAVASLVNDDEVCDMDNLPPVKFYKAWDEYGALSNFSPFPVSVDGVEWPTVEHYYQAQKFAGVHNDIARESFEKIKLAESPEAAAKIGRSAQAAHPESVRKDWDDVKVDVMRRALTEKLVRYEGPRTLLMESVCTDGRVRVIEDSPVDGVWGAGRDGTGQNLLGALLVNIREDLVSGRLDVEK